MKSAADYDTRAAIRSRYLGPTNHRGSRVVVEDDHPDDKRRLTVGWDDALDVRDNHVAACARFLAKFIPEAELKTPGLGFDNAYYWTWGHKS